MMKICLVGHEAGYFKGQGGIASYIDITAKGFAKLGYQVSVIYFTGSGVDYPGIENIKLEDTKSVRKNSELVDKALNEIRPSFVESTDFLGLIHQTLLKRSTKGIDYDCRFIVNHHTGIREIWDWGTEVDFFENRPRWFSEVYNAERTQALLADSNFSTSIFLSSYLGHLNEEFINYCPSYYPIEESEISKNNDKDRVVKNEKFRVISLGRFEVRKKQELLISACCDLISKGIDLEVTLIGNTTSNFVTSEDYMQYCYDMIPLEWKKHFKFFDFIPFKELKEKYIEYDVFIVPSPYENFPNTALDAISNGILTSGSITSGIKDMVGDTSSIVCFEPNSVEDISRVLKKIYMIGSAERKNLAHSQRNTLFKLTSHDSALLRREREYKEIASNFKKQNVSNCLFCYMAEGKVTDIFYKGSVVGNSWYDITPYVDKITGIIIVNDRNEHDLINKLDIPNVNRGKTVVAYIPNTTEQPSMTIKDFFKDKVSFYYAFIPCEQYDRKIWSIYDFIASAIFECKDLIEIRESKRSISQGIGYLIKYHIDRKKNGKI